MAETVQQPKKSKKNQTKNILLIVGVLLLTAAVAVAGYYSNARFWSGTADLAATQEAAVPPEQYELTAEDMCDLDTILIMDLSGSMTRIEPDGRQRLEWAKDAAKAYVDEMAKAQANTNNKIRIGLTTYGSYYGTPYNSGKIRQSITYNLGSVKDAIKNLRITSNYGTCIDCGLAAARADMTANIEDPDRPHVFIWISDGYGNRTLATGNSRVNLVTARTAAIQEAQRSKDLGYILNAIGYGSGTIFDPLTLTGVASDPDADHYFYRPDATSWTKTFVDMADDNCNVAPAIPDCTNLTADKDLNRLVVGEPVNFFVTASGGENNAPVTAVEASVYRDVCTNSLSSYDPVYVDGPGTYLAETWTPNEVGNFSVHGRVWNDGIAECKADCVDGPPRYLCASAEYCRLSGTVISPPTPTPTSPPPTITPTLPPPITPTPTPPPVLQSATFRVNTVKDMPFGSPSVCNGVEDLVCTVNANDRIVAYNYSYVVEYRDANNRLVSTVGPSPISTLNGDVCSSNYGYSPTVTLNAFPSGGTARLSLYYGYLAYSRALAVTGNNVMSVSTIRPGQNVTISGHVCLTNICSNCASLPTHPPTVTIN